MVPGISDILSAVRIELRKSLLEEIGAELRLYFLYAQTDVFRADVSAVIAFGSSRL